MSHNIGRLVAGPGTRIGPDGTTPPVAPNTWELAFVPAAALSGGLPRFVILHLTGMSLPGTARVEVELGYARDVFTAVSGTDVWSRPVDPTLGAIVVRYVGPGPAGGVTLSEYGSGEPWTTTYPPATAYFDSVTNADLFLHTNPYAEPTYQPWLECGGTFDWQNAACAPAGSAQEAAVRAVGIFVHADHDAVSGQVLLSSCSGTLIDTNLFLTARHCAVDVDELDIKSGSVCFGYQTDCGGARPAGFAPVFHKVRGWRARVGPTDARTTDTDWLILEIDPPPVGIAPRPLRATQPVANEPVFTVHHPNAAVKKLQSGVLPGNNVYQVTNFDYAGGSSGSALFDATGAIIGAALSTGAAGYNQCSVGYCPATKVLEALANPPAPPGPLDVMIVVDRSGSMGAPGTSGPGRTKMDEARDAASLFVQLVRVGAGDRLGLVSFSTTATHPPDAAPAVVTAAVQQQLVGPAPYTGGRVGGLAAAGSTSIGGGLAEALGALTPASGNQRALLLLTDGLQNTPPMVADVEGQLGTTKLSAVGFGADYALDGALLSRLSLDHGGAYTRANDGLELKKFFALAFGNIFQNGTLADPTFVLEPGETEALALTFDVSDESRITAVLGWDVAGIELEFELQTPAGATVSVGTPGTTADRGLTWTFLVVPLPIGGEREGTWRVVARRRTRRGGGGQRVRYFVSVVADGGPRLEPLLPALAVYTGDRLVPMVGLFYENVTSPHAEVMLTIDAPDGSVGALVAQAGLTPPGPGPDPVDAFTTTLQQVAAHSGGSLPIGRRTTTVELFDDGVHEDGGMESDGVYANPVEDLMRFEGTYTFRAVATYGETIKGRREAVWSIHVLPGIDPSTSTIVAVPSGSVAGGHTGGILVLTPRDRYGSPLGPGRGDRVTITGQSGTQITGPVTDNGDGTYTVPVEWDPSVTGAPAAVVTQPGRDPVVLGPPLTRGRRCPRWLCWLLAALVIVLLVLVIILIR